MYGDFRMKHPSQVPGCLYFAYQREEQPGVTEPHMVGYICFSREVDKAELDTHIKGDHVYVRRALKTPKYYSLYCTKEEGRVPGTMPYEWGTCPSSLVGNILRM